MEFTHYYGKHRRCNTSVIRRPVLHGKTIQIRLSGELWNRIDERCKEISKNPSELTRILWNNYFDKLDAKRQKIDVEDFIKNANTKIYRIAQ